MQSLIKKTIFLNLFVFLFFLISTSQANASSCSQLNSSAAIPDGFGASFNTQSNEKEQIIKSNCDETGVEIEVGNGSETQYVYSKGYIYDDNRWQIIDFSGDSSVSSWFKGNARSILSSDKYSFNGLKYVVAYVCTWINDEWKCGCRDEECTQNFWQLQIINKTSSINQQCKDNDRDGYGKPSTNCGSSLVDCDDTNPDINPGKTEICGNDIDENCDDEIILECGSDVETCQDRDRDKFDNCSPGDSGDDGREKDCDDTTKNVYPGARETCDNQDNNCDEEVDEKCDEDEDGYCDSLLPFYLNDNEALNVCPFSTDNGTQKGDDCDDNDGKKSPGTKEECDNIDNNCNLKIDEGGACCNDLDADGYNDCNTNIEGDDGKIKDCNDNNSSIYPEQTETCDGIDNNCNNVIDENCACVNGETQVCGVDTGICQTGTMTCEYGNWTECQGEIKAQAEICDSLDNDCDGQIDNGVCDTTAPTIESFNVNPKETSESVTVSWLVRDDTAIDQTEIWRTNDVGGVPSSQNWQLIHNQEANLDDYMNGTYSDSPAVGKWWYGLHALDTTGNMSTEPNGPIMVTISELSNCEDKDNDGYDNCSLNDNGDDGKQIDCNDNDEYAHPGIAYETCDTVDNNCNNQTDEGCDEDGDGFCNKEKTIYRTNSMCSKTPFIEGRYGNDCNDNNPDLNPGETEICDGIDNNCDTKVDDKCQCINGDTQTCGTNTGECQTGTQTCQNGFWTACQGETSSQTEICDGKDNNCNGKTDENLVAPLNDNQKGVCKDSLKTCKGLQGWQNIYTTITNNEYPSETSCDGLDNNCDGQTDENCACINGETTACGTNTGVCQAGTMTCEYGNWTQCQGEVKPKTEICGNGIDEDCDGGDLVCSDTIVPIVSSFNVSYNDNTKISTASFVVTDNIALKTVELWRSPDNAGVPGVWTRVAEKNISGTSNSGTLSDNTPSGTFWYGLHVLDANQNMGMEPSSPGPVKIETISCVDTSWTPLVDTVCSGVNFEQTSNCGNTKNISGTKPYIVSQYPAKYKGTNLNCFMPTGAPQSWYIEKGRCVEIGIPGATPANPVWYWIDQISRVGNNTAKSNFEAQYLKECQDLYGTSDFDICNDKALCNSGDNYVRNTTYCQKVNAECAPCEDTDDDGYDICAPGQAGDDGKEIDCNDNAWYMNPGAPETCDGSDNNCNGQIDENCDDDNDGYCDSSIRFYNYPNPTCPNTNLPNDSFGNDCNDDDSGINPGQTDVCDNKIDENCSGLADEGCPPCVDSIWTPSTDTVCSGLDLEQTSNCANTRWTLGTREYSYTAYPAKYKGTNLNCFMPTGAPQSWYIEKGRCVEIGIPGATPANPVWYWIDQISRVGNNTAKSNFEAQYLKECQDLYGTSDFDICNDKALCNSGDNYVRNTTYCQTVDQQFCDNIGTCIDKDNDGYDNCDLNESGDDGKEIDCDDNDSGLNPGETEICDGKDNNCNGKTDENLVAPLNDNQKGVCKDSFKTCNGLQGWQNIYTTITNNEYPSETSCDGLDNNCDGRVDENCACINGETKTCGSDVGVCQSGTMTCEYGNWTQCQGEVKPKTEICGNGIDEDCSGTDLGCEALIVSIENPKDASSFSQDTYGISFNSTVFGGKYPYTYKWTSDKNGDFGDKEYAFLSGSGVNRNEAFVLGEHKITLTVTDANGTQMSQTITINIKSVGAFEVKIVAGDNESVGSMNFVDSLQLSAKASGGVSPLTYSWSTTEKGIFSADQHAFVDLKTTPWSLGEHTVTVTAYDGNSLSTSDTAIVNIVNMDASIYSPSYAYYKSDVTFYTSAMGGTAPFDIKISSNLDGEMYHDVNSAKSYVSYKTNALREGLHQITLLVVDDKGNTATKSTLIQINPIDVSQVTCFDFSDCNDNLPCTDDVCSNPGTMTSSCSNVAKTTCQNNDNCCPGVCNNSNDSDCSVSADNDDPAKVLVIYNKKCNKDDNNNGINDYEEIALYYQQKRNIPDSNMLGIEPFGSSGCVSDYGLSRYETNFIPEIVTPIKNKLKALGENNIYYFALIGMPYSLGIDTSDTGSKHSGRSMDQALMTINSIDSPLGWPSYWDYTRSTEYPEMFFGTKLTKPRFNHSFKYDGDEMYLVTRIHDKELIDRALYGEKYIYNEAGYYRGMGYVDTRYKEYDDAYLNDNYPTFSDATSYSKGDRKMAYGKRIFEIEGWDYKWEYTGKEIGETGAVFTDGTSAESVSDALWYEGWYNFGTYRDVWTWKVGAVACDLNSNSGRVPYNGKAFLKGAFSKGLTAGTGVIGEPYLTGHPQPEVLIHYILNGYNFAEASNLSYPGFKWKDISYGDPLYNPLKTGKTKVKDTVKPNILQLTHQSNVSDTASSCNILVRLDLNAPNPDVATFKIEYGTNTNYSSVINYDEIYSSEKVLTLQNLLPNTSYHYRVIAKDPVGNTSVSGDNICKTSADKTILPDSIDVSASTQMGSAPLNVNFSSTFGSAPSSVKWNFADGSTSISNNPSHVFSKGFYKVILHAEFPNGLSAYKELLIISK